MSRLAVLHGFTLVDETDLVWANSRRWHISDRGYVKTYGGRTGATLLRMHRLILERVVGRKLLSTEFVDHVNGDILDNRRSNLRVATKHQNLLNRRGARNSSSKYAGVAFDLSRERWMAYINFDHRRYYLGRYESEIEAAWMYDQWALELHGDFVRLNLEYQEVNIDPTH